ncbi:MAG: bacteriohemerythrin [Sedimenticola sp.]
MADIDIFPWDDNFNTGLPKIDEQHRQLVHLLNKLASQFAFHSGHIELKGIFDELLDYTVYHFATEEQIWKEYLPGDVKETQHHNTHQEFIKTLHELIAEQKDKSVHEVAEDTLDFLVRWLASHILESDRYMAYLVIGLKDGLSMDEAKAHAGEQMSGFTRKMIDIILSIYGSLSSNTLRLMRELSRQKELEESVSLSNDALRISNERLEEAQRLGNIGNWEFNLKDDDLYWSNQIYRIFGIDQEKFGASYDAFLDAIHPDDREKVDEAYGYSVETGLPYDIVHRIIRKDDGEVRYVHEISNEIRDDQGEAVRSIGTVQDVTDRVLAEQAQMEHEQKLLSSLRQTVQAIALTVEKRDPYTAGHQRRVAELAVAIAGRMGLGQKEIEGIGLGAMIHDLGKISLPTEILTRPGRLSKVEFAVIKTHAEAGYEILKDVEFPWPVATMIQQHHERMDGSGYPQGLRGEEICIEARILAIADVVEAMMSHRPYRPELGLDKALDEIRKNRGTLYDEQAVESCLELFAEGFTLSPP